MRVRNQRETDMVKQIRLQIRFQNSKYNSPNIARHSNLAPIENQGLQID